MFSRDCYFELSIFLKFSSATLLVEHYNYLLFYVLSENLLSLKVAFGCNVLF